ncbi:MAG: nucleotidyl transferase AbiEii/AbiGii toxin family protein [Lautropia sp.]|nr:nucleotidyl transferase AbiEii/AbiGii toxin family protein [Lautropia sp.]
MRLPTREEVISHRQHGSWRKLEQVALAIIRDVRQHGSERFNPILGGGTRLMLELDHRISHDIDLFIRDPQWIGYISPRLNDRVEDMVSTYDEAADYLKLVLPEGEIDFIVRGSLLGLPEERSGHTPLPLEPVAEVLAKKLFFRGAMLTPRDLFDWWAVETLRPGLVPQAEIGALLKTRQEGIAHMLKVLERSARGRALWDEILAPDKPALAEVLSWAKDRLAGYAGANAGGKQS